MDLKWTDIQDIAIELYEKYPYVDPKYVNFPDMHRWICELDEFDDFNELDELDGENILEAIQQAWIKEYES